MMTKQYLVQYGCGWSAPFDWRNFDASPTLRFERMPVIGRLYTKNASRFPANAEYGDIVKGLPVPKESCDAVYCSHVLEHLSLDEFRIALLNTHSILKPGAIFRLVLPDLEYLIEQYRSNQETDAAFTFMRDTGLGRASRNRGLLGMLKEVLGNSNHLWMWDFKSIQTELITSGFSEVRRAFYGDSHEPAFASVESKDRWDNCLGLECIKPSR